MALVNGASEASVSTSLLLSPCPSSCPLSLRPVCPSLPPGEPWHAGCIPQPRSQLRRVIRDTRDPEKHRVCLQPTPAPCGVPGTSHPRFPTSTSRSSSLALWPKTKKLSQETRVFPVWRMSCAEASLGEELVGTELRSWKSPWERSPGEAPGRLACPRSPHSLTAAFSKATPAPAV